MDNYEFYLVLLEHVGLFITLLFFSSVFHALIFRRILYSWLDPYFLPVVANVFGLTVVYLLYFTEHISTYTFLSYTLTQIVFFTGLFFFKIPFYFAISDVDLNDGSLSGQSKYKVVAFYFFSIIYLVSQGVIYRLKGIPIFMESRLSTFADGGGAGVLGRITDVTSIFALYSFFCVIRLDKFRFSEIPKYIILMLIFVTYFLSGGKGNFLSIFYVFWCYLLFSKLKRVDYSIYSSFIRKHLRKMLIGGALVVSGIIVVQASAQGGEINPGFVLALRFLHNGDIYWYAYPNNIYLKLPSDQGFAALFTDALGLFRLVSWDHLPKAIGISFKDIHHPSDIPTGANARHNVFGLIYYGFLGSLLFSYCLGVIISFVRFRLAYLLKNNMLGGFIFTYLFLKISTLDTDPMLALTYINNLVFIFPVLYIGYLIIVAFISSNPLSNEFDSKNKHHHSLL